MNNPFSTTFGLDTNNFSVYRDRLIKKELLNLALMDLYNLHCQD